MTHVELVASFLLDERLLPVRTARRWLLPSTAPDRAYPLFQERMTHVRSTIYDKHQTLRLAWNGKDICYQVVDA